jgi:pilus assembly protein CpaB
VNRKKSTGIVASAVLAVFGMLLLVMFAKGRGDSAAAKAEAQAAPVEAQKWVYVASIDIAKGTQGDAVEPLVARVQRPVSQVVVGADAEVDFKIETIRGKLTALPISKNQQITNAMFESTEAAASAALPAGKLAVTLIIPGDRMAGIGKNAGETVGVIASFAGAEGGSVSHITMHKLQIIGRPTPFGIAPPTTVAGQPNDAGTSSFLGQVQVTLAVDAADAERLIFMNQFGIIHLVLEPLSANEGDTKKITLENVYVPTGASSALDDLKTSTTIAGKPAVAAPAVAAPAVAAPAVAAPAAAAPTTLPGATTTIKK